MRPPVVLSIGGSDPSGGSGIQADMKTATALGVYGSGAITALSIENTQGISKVHTVAVPVIRDQVRAVLDDLHVDTIKIGMLGSVGAVDAVVQLLREHRGTIGLVIYDPVILTGAGDPLASPEEISAIVQRLLPLTDLVTPNIPEAALLLDGPMASDEHEMEDQARRLLATGTGAVLLKGGQLRGSESVDLFVTADGAETLRGPRVDTRNTHGTGCTLSTAIASIYASVYRDKGSDLDVPDNLDTRADEEADDDEVPLGRIVATAREFLADAIIGAKDWELSFHPERGHGPVDHLITVTS